jgi:hypothetical protein
MFRVFVAVVAMESFSALGLFLYLHSGGFQR